MGEIKKAFDAVTGTKFSSRTLPEAIRKINLKSGGGDIPSDIEEVIDNLSREVDIAKISVGTGKQYFYPRLKSQTVDPSAKIIVLIPKTCVYDLSGTYSMERQAKTFAAIKEIAEQLGVYKIIDLRQCGINTSNTVSYSDSSNGIHPNAAGMKIIADYIISQMID